MVTVGQVVSCAYFPIIRFLIFSLHKSVRSTVSANASKTFSEVRVKNDSVLCSLEQELDSVVLEKKLML